MFDSGGYHNSTRSSASTTLLETLPYTFTYRGGGIFYGWLALVASLAVLGLYMFPFAAVLGVMGVSCHGLGLFNYYTGARRSTRTYMHLSAVFCLWLLLLILWSVLSIFLYVADPERFIGDKTVRVYGYDCDMDMIKMPLVFTCCFINATYSPCLFFAQKHWQELRHFHRLELASLAISNDGNQL